jgi:hypothetical protein
LKLLGLLLAVVSGGANTFPDLLHPIALISREPQLRRERRPIVGHNVRFGTQHPLPQRSGNDASAQRQYRHGKQR